MNLQVDLHPLRWSLSLALIGWTLTFPCSNSAFAQAGSTGGSIGKQGKAASGDSDQPSRRKAPAKKQHESKQSHCPNIVGIWSSWASGLFGQDDTSFKRDGTAFHRSGIAGTWQCDSGQMVIQWADGVRHVVTFSADRKQVFKTDGTLVFRRD
jgi:hypothetical protein